jgi:hypothetical protein
MLMVQVQFRFVSFVRFALFIFPRVPNERACLVCERNGRRVKTISDGVMGYFQNEFENIGSNIQ